MAISENELISAVVHAGLIDSEKLTEVRRISKRDRIRIMDAIMRTQRFPNSAFYQAYAEMHNIPFVQPGQLHPDWDVLGRMPMSLAQRRKVLPVKMLDGVTRLALADPSDRASQDAISRATNLDLPVAVAEPESLESAIVHAAGGTQTANDEFDSVALLDDIMKEAYLSRSSDIHIEPEREDTRVRLRVDGQLKEYRRRLNRDESASLLNRVKVLAGMDIAEQRAPQDGGFSYAVQDWNMDPTDFRVAVTPTRWGERATMRIMGQSTDAIELAKVGMPAKMLEEFRQTLTHPHGMLLVTGPTGSGKSTTLYGALRELNSGVENILTAEDPIEQEIEGISQISCSGKINFASALRSFLRQDPDIILVGEIRDYETADIAFKAAMTGHLVLSTLHTNNALSAVTRLVDLGCERFLVADSLIGVVAQRLVRRLCQQCRKDDQPSDEETELLELELGEKVYRPVGCAACLGQGYTGRVGLFESLWINPELAIAISQGMTFNQLRESATQYQPLWQDAREKVLNGTTSVDEVQPMKFASMN
ncbi:MAG: ATPase, T2SS/T4P/T4SS family [Pseudomonadota bacterium]